MRRLAIEGGAPIVRTPIAPLRTIGAEERAAVGRFMATVEDGTATLSGYLAGSERGGPAVQRLEEVVANEFGVKHAIACNSATSGLLAACMSVGVKHGKTVTVPTMGMSAAAAVPLVLGAYTVFHDVDKYFCANLRGVYEDEFRASIIVNLFGHPGHLAKYRSYCDEMGIAMIEDAAQSPWATEDGKWAGTVGHIGVFSLNVHKPWNAGEGGICVTDSDELAARMRGRINHGEMSEHGAMPGLNLRMPELTAIIALTQMPRAKRIVASRQALAHTLNNLLAEQKVFTLPTEREGCVSSWYCWPLLAPDRRARDWAGKALRGEGVPVTDGYVLQHKLKAFYTGVSLPVAEDLEGRMLLLQLCSIDPTAEQVEMMAEAIGSVGDMLNG